MPAPRPPQAGLAPRAATRVPRVRCADRGRSQHRDNDGRQPDTYCAAEPESVGTTAQWKQGHASCVPLVNRDHTAALAPLCLATGRADDWSFPPVHRISRGLCDSLRGERTSVSAAADTHVGRAASVSGDDRLRPVLVDDCEARSSLGITTGARPWGQRARMIARVSLAWSSNTLARGRARAVTPCCREGRVD
jgi:hypothetical protein